MDFSDLVQGLHQPRHIIRKALYTALNFLHNLRRYEGRGDALHCIHIFLSFSFVNANRLVAYSPRMSPTYHQIREETNALCRGFELY